MEYTDQQRAAFRDDYAKRFRKQLIMLGLLVLVMTPLAFTEDGDTVFGLSLAFLGPTTLGVAIACSVIFSDRNWRCPACNKSLGRAFHPKQCRQCGIELRA